MFEGDVLKLRTQSAVSGTGGGARDLRFGPWDEFQPVVARMLPETITKRSSRKVDGTYMPHEVEVHRGRLRWVDTSQHEREFFFWPPTTARAFEGRIATAYKIPPLSPDRWPGSAEGEVFALVWQDDEGVWGQYVTEGALRTPPDGAEWHPLVRTEIIDGLDAAQERESKGKGRPVSLRGFIDIEAGDRKSFIGNREI